MQKIFTSAGFGLNGMIIIFPWSILFIWLQQLKLTSSPWFALLTNLGAFGLYTTIMILFQLIVRPTRILFFGTVFTIASLLSVCLCMLVVEDSTSKHVCMAVVLALLFGATAAFHSLSFALCFKNQSALVFGLNMGGVLTTLVDIACSNLKSVPLSIVAQISTMIVCIHAASWSFSHISVTKRLAAHQNGRMITSRNANRNTAPGGPPLYEVVVRGERLSDAPDRM